jgi:hypothetical protein
MVFKIIFKKKKTMPNFKASQSKNANQSRSFPSWQMLEFSCYSFFFYSTSSKVSVPR